MSADAVGAAGDYRGLAIKSANVSPARFSALSSDRIRHWKYRTSAARMAPGWCAFACTNIVQEIQNTLTTTHYALAVIGPDWLTMTSGAGQRWLDRLSFQSS